MNIKKIYNFQRITCIILITLTAVSSINLTAFASNTSNINKPTDEVNTKGLTKEQEFIYNDLFAPNVLQNNKEEILDDSTPIKLTNDIILATEFENLNSIILSYNEDGLNDNISDIQENNISFEYNENGKILTSTIKDKSGKIQLIKKYKYNEAGSVESLLVENSRGIALTDYTFTYDKFDNLKMKKDNVTGKYVKYKYNKTKKFSQERYHQMTDEIYYDSDDKVITKISYKYDKSGNRLKKEVELGKDKYKLTYEYNDNQLIKSSDNISYIYDENGNIIDNGQLKNKFDSNNQLIESETTNNTAVSFDYNDKNHRISKTVNNEKNNYYYMAGDIAGITDENSNLKYFFTRDENNRLLGFVDYTSANPKKYWYILDDHQSVVGLVDENGEKVVSYEYDGFGNITKEAGTVLTGDGKLLKDANPFKYSSYIFDDETGYYYLKARYYDPKIGRFISTDSFKDHFDTPIHQNVYLYCLNNPVNFYDPSGYILLNINSTGNDVVNIQAKLVILGHLDITNTKYGYYDSRTYEAVKAFQRSKDLVEDGIVGNNTWNELIKQGEFYLALGSKGAKVTKMQTELNRRGYELGAIDGDFGQNTLAAINVFKDSTLPGGNQGKFRGLIGATTWYDHLFPLGEVILTIPQGIQINQSVNINVYSKNAHHLGFEVTDPSGNKTWFGNTEGESYSAQFTPTIYGEYKIVGASRNTATSNDLGTERKQSYIRTVYIYKERDRVIKFASNGQAFKAKLVKVTDPNGVTKLVPWPEDLEAYELACRVQISRGQFISLVIGITPVDIYKDTFDFIEGEDIITHEEVNRYALAVCIFTPEIIDLAIKQGAKNADEIVGFIKSTKGTGNLVNVADDVFVNGSKHLDDNPLANIKYTDKVVEQMKQGDFHGFPDIVDNYGSNGIAELLKGGDEIVRTRISIPGNYKGKNGVFEYIIEPDGVTCNHRFFKVDY